MKSLVSVLALLVALYGYVKVLMLFRAKAMCTLAGRCGFQFIDRPLPASFCMTCDPFDGSYPVTVSNVIEGQRNGISVLVFDSAIANMRWTFIAVQTEKDPFATDGKLCKAQQSNGWMGVYKTLQSNGWTALYRYDSGILVYWTMSTREIEDHLLRLQI